MNSNHPTGTGKGDAATPIDSELFPFRFEKTDGKWRVTDLNGGPIDTSSVTYEEMLPGAMKHTKLLHTELTIDQQKLCRYSFKRAGRFLVSTYEQWERGFLRELDPLGDLFFWTKLAGFMDTLASRNQADARATVLACCTNTMDDELRKWVDAYFDASNGDEECQTAFREWDEWKSLA